MVTQAKHLMLSINQRLDEHPAFKAFLDKLQRDNVGMLAGFVSWSIITSIVPIVVGVVAISSLFLQSPSSRHDLEQHLSSALQGVLSPRDIQDLVTASTQHRGLLGIIGFLGIFWGGSNVGGAISTAFQAIFEVSGRNFVKEKLIDVGMVFVFTALMLLILAGTTASAFLNHIFSGFPHSNVVGFIIATGLSFTAGLLLFTAIYVVFPNTHSGYRLRYVWRGALLSAVLFQIASYIWPIYVSVAHFQRYAALVFSLLVLTAWIYFFSMIMMIGAEVIAISSIREAQSEGESIGPPPQNFVPQHRVLRLRRRKD